MGSKYWHLGRRPPRSAVSRGYAGFYNGGGDLGCLGLVFEAFVTLVLFTLCLGGL